MNGHSTSSTTYFDYFKTKIDSICFMVKEGGDSYNHYRFMVDDNEIKNDCIELKITRSEYDDTVDFISFTRDVYITELCNKKYEENKHKIAGGDKVLAYIEITFEIPSSCIPAPDYCGSYTDCCLRYGGKNIPGGYILGNNNDFSPLGDPRPRGTTVVISTGSPVELPLESLCIESFTFLKNY